MYSCRWRALAAAVVVMLIVDIHSSKTDEMTGYLASEVVKIVHWGLNWGCSFAEENQQLTGSQRASTSFDGLSCEARDCAAPLRDVSQAMQKMRIADGSRGGILAVRAVVSESGTVHVDTVQLGELAEKVD